MIKYTPAWLSGLVVLLVLSIAVFFLEPTHLGGDPLGGEGLVFIMMACFNIAFASVFIIVSNIIISIRHAFYNISSFGEFSFTVFVALLISAGSVVLLFPLIIAPLGHSDSYPQGVIYVLLALTMNWKFVGVTVLSLAISYAHLYSKIKKAAQV